MKPRVTILVAAYNAASTLPRCLDSLLVEQTLRDIEVIAVDDCSTDHTLQLLTERAAADPRLHVLQTEHNSGQAVARNQALAVAQGEFTCMVDADDWLSPDCLEQAVQIFDRHPRTDSVVLHLMQHFEDGSEEEYPLPRQLTEHTALTGTEAFELCIDSWQLHGLYVVRTALHKQYPFDTTTRLYSDDNTSRLHYLHSREVRLCPGIYHYRKHAASTTNAFHMHRFDFMEAQLSLLLTLKKENVAPRLIKLFEGQRWYVFISCYRLYLRHKAELSDADRKDLQARFRTILHTFRPSRLRLRYRWKPFYMLTTNVRLFDLQQRLYMRIKG